MISAIEMIEDIEDHESKLNDWERDFVDSVRRKLEADPNYELSPRQYNKLEGIHDWILDNY